MATHSSILAWKIPWTEESGVPSPWGRKEFLLMWLFLLLLFFRREASRGQIKKDITYIYHSLSTNILFPSMIFIANLSRLGLGFCLSFF